MMVGSLQQVYVGVVVLFETIESQWKEIADFRSILDRLNSQTKEMDIQLWYGHA